MKHLRASHVNSNVKMQGRCPGPLRPRLRLKKCLRLPSLQVPADWDYSRPDLLVLKHVLLNERLGTSVIAAGYQVIAVGTGNAGKLFEVTDQRLWEAKRRSEVR